MLYVIIRLLRSVNIFFKENLGVLQAQHPKHPVVYGLVNVQLHARCGQEKPTIDSYIFKYFYKSNFIYVWYCIIRKKLSRYAYYTLPHSITLVTHAHFGAESWCGQSRTNRTVCAGTEIRAFGLGVWGMRREAPTMPTLNPKSNCTRGAVQTLFSFIEKIMGTQNKNEEPRPESASQSEAPTAPYFALRDLIAFIISLVRHIGARLLWKKYGLMFGFGGLNYFRVSLRHTLLCSNTKSTFAIFTCALGA